MWSARQTLTLLVEAHSELVFEPGGTQQANRIVPEDLKRNRPENPGLEVAATAEGIDRLPPGERDRDRVDREVPRAEVRLDPVRERREVDQSGRPEKRPAKRRGGPRGLIHGAPGKARI